MQSHSMNILWEKISSLGILPNLDRTELIRIRLLNQTATVALLMCTFALPLYIYGGTYELLIVDFLCILIVSIILLINYFGNNHLAWHVGQISIPILLCVVSFFIQPVSGLALICLAFISITRYLYNDKKIKWLYYALYGLASIIILLSPVLGGRQIEFPILHNVIQATDRGSLTNFI